MNTQKQQINTEHPRIKNRDPREQKLRDEIVKTLKAWIKTKTESYNKRTTTSERRDKLPTTKWSWVHEMDGCNAFNRPFEDKLRLSRLLNDKALTWLIYKDKVLAIAKKWQLSEEVFSHLKWTLNRDIAFELIEKGQIWNVVTHISSFQWLTADDCEKIASWMLKVNVFRLASHLHEFPVITQKMVDEGIASRNITYEIVAKMDIYKKQWIDPKSIALKLIEIKHHYLVAAYFKKFWWRDLGIDIIHKVLSTPDDGSITKSLPNIISEKTFDQLPATLFADNRFVALILSVCPTLYDKIQNPNKAFIKQMLWKLQWKNLWSIDIDPVHWVVSYIEWTVRDTGAWMEYGNYVRAIYNGEEKQTHVVYRDWYSASKDNWDLCFSHTKIVSLQTQWDNIIITVKASKWDTYSRDYSFTFKKWQEDTRPTLDESAQAQFLTLVEDIKNKIKASETGKYDGCTMTPYFKCEKINAEKWVAVVVLFKQIDYSITASWNQYAYEAIKINADGSYSRLDYKAARDYDRKAWNNIVLDAQDYTV